MIGNQISRVQMVLLAVWMIVLWCSVATLLVYLNTYDTTDPPSNLSTLWMVFSMNVFVASTATIVLAAVAGRNRQNRLHPGVSRQTG